MLLVLFLFLRKFSSYILGLDSLFINVTLSVAFSFCVPPLYLENLSGHIRCSVFILNNCWLCSTSGKSLMLRIKGLYGDKP